MSPDQMEQAAKAMQGKLPAGLGGMGGLGKGLSLPSGLSGLMKKK
jgi:signal recognition particle subunit SRP54